MNKLKLRCFLCVFLSLMFFGGFNSYASSTTLPDQKEKIKVFFPLQYGYSYLDESGNPAGYTYEYLMKVAQRTGWEYEFIVVENTEENIAKGIKDLQDGKIDIMGMVSMEDQYEDILSYTTTMYGQVMYYFMALPDAKEINNRTLHTILSDLTIALNESNPGDIAAFESFTSTYPFPIKTISAPTSEACIALLESGQADLTLRNSTMSPLSLRTINPYYVEYIYFATSKTNTELWEELDFAVSEVETAANFYFRMNLEDKHFPPYQQPFLSLTADESAYIATSSPLRVGILDNKAPISDFNPETNDFEGIVVNYMREFEARSGLTFSYINVANQEELAKLSKNGEIDLILGFPNDYALAADYDILLSSSMLKIPIVRITSKHKNIKNQEILTSLSTYFTTNSEKYKQVEFVDEIFEMLNDGDYRSAYVNGYIAQRIMGQHSYQNLVMTSVPSSNYDLCIGVSKTLDSRIMSILEQSISQMPSSEKEDIIYQNTTVTPELDLWDIIQNNPSKLALPILVVFLIIIVLLLMLFYKSIRLNRMIALERSRYKEKSSLDQMTDVYNNETFKNLAREYLASPSPCEGVLIICDLDDFKSINDSYGHLYGDITLQNFAKQLKETFPTPSIVGRIGGDEFAVLIRQTIEEPELSRLCTQLLEECAKFDLARPVTISLGASIFCENMEFDKLFDFADSTLYKVKEAGKNNFIIEKI